MDDEGSIVFSEMVFVKREILDSYFSAVKKLGRITRKRMINGKDRRGELSFMMYTYNMFQKLRPFFNEKRVNKEDKKLLNFYAEKVDESFIINENIKLEDWYKIFMACRRILFDLGIYKIGMTTKNPPLEFMEGLTDA
jgi:hypothetical protein